MSPGKISNHYMHIVQRTADSVSIEDPFNKAERGITIKVRWEKEVAHIMDIAVSPDEDLLAIACLPAAGAPGSKVVDPSTASTLGMDSLRVCLYKTCTGAMLMKVSKLPNGGATNGAEAGFDRAS